MSTTPSLRKRAQLPRRRRSGLAVVIGIVVLAALILGGVAAVQIYTHHDLTVLGRASAVAHGLRGTEWSDSLVLLAAIVCLVLGGLILLAGIVPARRPFIRLEDPDAHTITGLTRAGFDRDLAAVASAVDGVSSARVAVNRRRVVVTARSALRDASGLDDAVRKAVSTRVDGLRPERPLPVTVRVRGGGE